MDKQPDQIAAQPDSPADGGVSDWRSGHGHPLRLWRQKHKISLESLAFETGLSPASLSRIERYKQTPLIDAAKRIIASSGGTLQPSDFFA